MQTRKTAVSTAGFPRIGEKRELKKSLEAYWSGRICFDEVQRTGRELRTRHWLCQKDAGIDIISCNDFSYYDLMLDMTVMLGAIPERFRKISQSTERYFAMARGCKDAVAMEMTKWFNTNYHYIVPELSGDMQFSLDCTKIIEEYREAKSLGISPKINIIGPLTYLLISKRSDQGRPIDLLPNILPMYEQLFKEISLLDDRLTIQCDETALARDTDEEILSLAVQSYERLGASTSNIDIIFLTAYDHACETVRALRNVPLYAIALDFVYGKENETVLADFNGKKLFAGIVDGRNIWKNNYRESLALLGRIRKEVPVENIVISTSCSLLHVPYSLEYEKSLDSEIRSWMSFATEKLIELKTLSELFSSDIVSESSCTALNENDALFMSRMKSERVHNPQVKRDFAEIKLRQRAGSFEERIALQKKILGLPLLPTTTIGSFPQTAELRKLRADFKKNRIIKEEYDDCIKNYIVIVSLCRRKPAWMFWCTASLSEMIW